MPNLVKVTLSSRIVLLFCATAFFQSVAVGQASVVSGSVSNSKINYLPGVGNNCLIVVAVSNENNNNVRTVSSITWGGQNLTFAVGRTNAGSGSNDLRTETWYLDEAGINAASGYVYFTGNQWSAGAHRPGDYPVTLQALRHSTSQSHGYGDFIQAGGELNSESQLYSTLFRPIIFRPACGKSTVNSSRV